MGGVKVGSWGGDGGINPWTFTLPDGCKFTKITIVSTRECIYSIRFTFQDTDKHEHDSPSYGGETDYGTKETVRIKDGEYITGISGTVGNCNGYTVITSLCIKVGITEHPFGQSSGRTPFTLPVTLGNFTGFFGNYGGYLDSLGAILSPNN